MRRVHPRSPARNAEELTFRDRTIDAVVAEDGSLHVSDTHTVAFKDSFTWMEDYISFERGSRLADVTLRE